MAPEKNLTIGNKTSPVDDTLTALTEAITGIAASDRKDLFLSVGYLLQRLRGRAFLEALKIEWDGLRRKGRIKDGYAETEQSQACLQELLDCLDKDSPDKVRFDFIKKVFLIAATESKSNRDDILPQQFMDVARKLSAGEILVLAATFEASKTWLPKPHYSVSEWLGAIATKSGLNLPNLVELYEDELMKKRILTPRVYPDRSGITLGDHYRLTPLGFSLCEYVSAYEALETQ